jgi:hypothetical protein
VWVSINATVDYEDVDPVHTVPESSFRRGRVEEVAVWALRDDVGGRSLEQALDSQAEINLVLPPMMEQRVAGLGVKVTRVEVTALAPSSNKPHEGITDFLRAPGFAVVLRGCDRGQVDDLLQRASEALASNRPELRAALAQALREPPLRVRLRGYDRVEVDLVLAQVGQMLAEI